MKVAPSFEKVLITIIKKTVLINVTCTQTYCIFLCMNQPFMTSFSVPKIIISLYLSDRDRASLVAPILSGNWHKSCLKFV